jgi:hypothetical protein
VDVVYRTLCFPFQGGHQVVVFLVLALLGLWNLVAVALLWALAAKRFRL